MIPMRTFPAEPVKQALRDKQPMSAHPVDIKMRRARIDRLAEALAVSPVGVAFVKDGNDAPQLAAILYEFAEAIVREGEERTSVEFVSRFQALTDGELVRMAERWPNELDRGPSGPLGWKADCLRFLAKRRQCVSHLLKEVRRVLSKR